MDEELFREQYNNDLIASEKMCKEIDYKLKQLGNLANPDVNMVKTVVRECTNIEEKSAFLFFARAFGYVPHPTRGKVAMYESMYNWQKIAAVKFLTGTRFISKKVRQIGATTFVSTYFLWRALFYGNTNAFILSLGSRESTDVLSRVTFMYNALPAWLKTPLLEGAKTSIMFKNNSKVIALPGTPDALRGRSSTSIILDEFAFLNHADKILSAAVPSLSMGFLTPFTNSSLPSQLFIISTFPLVDSDNNEYVRLYKNSIYGDSEFKILSVFTDDVPEYSNSSWRKSMLETLGPKKYAVEIEGKMNMTLDNSFFPEHVIAELQPKQPLRTDFLSQDDVDEYGFPVNIDSITSARENYDPSIGYIKNLWIWADPLPKKDYAITVDVSAGVGNDYSSIQIIDLEEQNQVGEYYSNKVSLEDFKHIIRDIAFFYNNAKLSIERNSLGAPLCSFFYETLKYENFYIHRKGKNSYIEGFPVTSANRGAILATLQSALIKKEITINSIRTINEIRTFVFLPNGRLGASIGNHDDLILALAQYAFLREVFFNTATMSDYGEDFLRKVEMEAEKIKIRHYMNGPLADEDDAERELQNIMAGYAVDPHSLRQWKNSMKDF
jgi:hypothetical protein